VTVIITWNIQSGRGVDGRTDLTRIARVVRELGPADAVCLQEVARFSPDLDGGAGADQVQILAEHFGGCEPLFGAAYSRRADELRRQERGNVILSRLPVLQAFAHPLPQPAAPGVKHMPRQAMEVVLRTAEGSLRLITTHLEFHSKEQRLAQADRLRPLQAAANLRRPGQDVKGPYARWPRPAETVLCGDFNFVPGGDEYSLMLGGFDDGTPGFLDSWMLAHPGLGEPYATHVLKRGCDRLTQVGSASGWTRRRHHCDRSAQNGQDFSFVQSRRCRHSPRASDSQFVASLMGRGSLNPLGVTER
jgi:endonuclease/exonuclease/phosphatase family metal-dependent hydrolase